MDKNNRVIYVGSFSKSLFPGLRIGLIVSDQLIENENGETVPLITEMSKVKAQLSINTSTICQGILGGILIDLNYSLQTYNETKFKSYKKKNEALIAALTEHIASCRTSWAKDIHWTEPHGGFFIKITVPFEVNESSVIESAEKFGIIFSPMRFFYLDKGGENEIHLTFSNLSLEKITEGIKKLADYFKYRIMVVSDHSKFELNAAGEI